MIRSKTLWSGISGLVGAAAGYFTGTLSLEVAVQLAVTSLLAIFLRHGISKTAGGSGDDAK